MDSLIVFIALNALAAGTGIIFRPGEWYKSIDKPDWRPADSLFPPVWTLLYLMIAVAGWLVFEIAGFGAGRWALIAYGVQLGLNALWSPLFFGLHRPAWAFGNIMVMWIAIVVTIVLFYPISATAAFLLGPYLAWVSFAAALNLSIWQRNT